MMSLPVWLSGPMFLLGREVSVPGPMFLLGGLCPGASLSGGVSPGGCLCLGCLSRGVSLSGRRILLECFLVGVYFFQKCICKISP